jgi:hypothetical protein
MSTKSQATSEDLYHVPENGKAELFNGELKLMLPAGDSHGLLPCTGGKFLQGAPLFAFEVPSEGDFGPAAEREIAAKRRDYFAAGTANQRYRLTCTARLAHGGLAWL